MTIRQVEEIIYWGIERIKSFWGQMDFTFLKC
ncbi:hypothetical protein FHS90_001828 [Rufibacter quisquiliarum]|uniref:Uncharacterized protein n=1 Tax=Rufibacter quisquiliarum TaxID=1549639 RepID=A0A839GQE3_9BACT|nr:hypothetical protein [Rufibacter quisquiliarum]